MPARRNRPVTAEGLIQKLSAHMKHFLRFLEVDLTPAIAQTGHLPRVSSGASSSSWILHLQTILQWSSLALEEEEWLKTQGLDRPLPGSHIRGVWSMPTFLRYLGRSKDHNACSDLQQGRLLQASHTEILFHAQRLRTSKSKYQALVVSIPPMLMADNKAGTEQYKAKQ